MSYIIIGLIVLLGAGFLFYEKWKIGGIRRNGVKVVGTIISNSDGRDTRYRLGGTINHPTIRFNTVEGRQITGRPIVGFISQELIEVPSEIYIIYSKSDPERFCIATS